MTARILIVEDQLPFMIQSLLELYGDFTFDIAKDGYVAIEKLAGELPDLILLDLRLPGLSGMAVLDAIRKVDPYLPVIVVSAFGDKITRQEAARRGATDFFQKPISTMRLYRRIKERLATVPDRSSKLNTLVLTGREAETLAKYRRLNKLRERKALLGLSAPPDLLIEIEDMETELLYEK